MVISMSAGLVFSFWKVLSPTHFHIISIFFVPVIFSQKILNILKLDVPSVKALWQLLHQW
jgi:hypothetical protein